VVNEIRILDLVETASTYEDGEVVFQKLLDEIDAGHRVAVSFEGIRSVPSAFINAALLKLLETHTYQEIQTALEIRHSTRQINELVRSRFDFVRKHGG
jgi:hypothetical protein